MGFSLVLARRLSCPTACGILVPRPGIEPVSPALEDRFLTTGPPGKSPTLDVFDLKKLFQSPQRSTSKTEAVRRQPDIPWLLASLSGLGGPPGGGIRSEEVGVRLLRSFYLETVLGGGVDLMGHPFMVFSFR